MSDFLMDTNLITNLLYVNRIKNHRNIVLSSVNKFDNQNVAFMV